MPANVRYTIEPITRQWRAGAVAALVEAFMTDPLFTFTIPNDRDRRAFIRNLAPEQIRQCARHGDSRVVVADGKEVVGTLCAGPYPPSKLHVLLLNLRLTILPTPWRPNLVAFWPMFTYMKTWEAMHYKDPHVYVYVIGIHPGHQRRRLGRRLMEGLHERCDARDVPVYLETQTEANVPFYQSLGYQLTEEHRPFEDGPPTWGFFRAVGA